MLLSSKYTDQLQAMLDTSPYHGPRNSSLQPIVQIALSIYRQKVDDNVWVDKQNSWNEYFVAMRKQNITMKQRQHNTCVSFKYVYA